ncbi:MAG: pyrimidine-nucleoside phosphorylase [Epulopiscium sp.]|uniref:Pyrimidine-nucleoside phosphorylase n=1 Tax=Defluviitalea raffinosedens TaxID=1450156 RepID=A0A7C8LB40_9FIRM|nr:pyrimidine-nucleoside phosphorylase [Defluviitalea raffinosedens]MBZ4667889.1 pyrimidine-nucleoside phosphorylase [Defluviitaleaceae bacterium]MDK2788897.1 pyrimidine-nucleoside phosphorylase [Candidatus Epulonipiscium sp.]KAE9629833.1 pyrimidine-nucleoside phosphorylase [Defluviitalea raffinosedens]MBM7686631.1 pyrimidine-nucleoside phosphorylase/thymidine phosphorylase [Defluviitalea raffinosedens]HHW67886.1 pyrimidine-nucleoside phosphorylase [Candidatus Epulonipiscium sp.]
MRMYDLILKKRNGEELTKEEIDFIISGYVQGEIPDYQISTFLMAVYFRGMTKQEISNLTLSFVHSGDVVDLSSIEGIKVDKHSTGGVGDKISLIIIPLVASLGIPVAKMSGRGLGHTGGTIDKLESIEGFRTELDSSEFIHNVNTYKMAIVGQTANLTPADKKIYALRDVTATVDSIPLIASSIMSKKIASGSDAIVLDVKVGSGAFMKSIDDAEELARTMVDIGKSLNRKTIAVLTNMDQPLGHEVGNANEIKEVIDVLSNKGAEDETTIALTIASHMAVLGGAYNDFDSAFRVLKAKIENGEAINKFKEFIKIQGGNPEVVDHPELLPQAKHHIEIKASSSGYITSINAESIGISAMLLGAGRRTKEDKIDFAAGITLTKKIGDKVDVGETICVLHTNLENTNEAQNIAKEAFRISEEKPAPVKYVYKVIQ